jgi:Tfp pilus assembly protein PilX
MRRSEQGVTILVVLVMLSVMLLGGLALARLTEISTLASGNSSYREGSLQASEVGLNEAFKAVRAAGFNEESNAGTWYWATQQSTDTQGVPSVSFDAAPEVVVGKYSVRYVVDRLCTTAPVTNTLLQCLVKQVPQTESSKVGEESVDPPNSRQFRVTVRVTGPKDTQTWIQGLLTKG